MARLSVTCAETFTENPRPWTVGVAAAPVIRGDVASTTRNIPGAGAQLPFASCAHTVNACTPSALNARKAVQVPPEKVLVSFVVPPPGARTETETEAMPTLSVTCAVKVTGEKTSWGAGAAPAAAGLGGGGA